MDERLKQPQTCILQKICQQFSPDCANNWYHVEECPILIAYNQEIETKRHQESSELEHLQAIDSQGYHPIIHEISRSITRSGTDSGVSAESRILSYEQIEDMRNRGIFP